MTRGEFTRLAIRIGLPIAACFLGAVVWAYWSRTPSAEVLAEGRMLFEHEWKPDDPLAGGDGLGPVFNAKSCVACHFQGGVGGGGDNRFNVTAFEVLPRPYEKEMKGGVVHAAAVHDQLLETSSLVRNRYPILREFTTSVNGCLTVLVDVDPLIMSTVNTPPLFGLGLIEEIPGYSIQASGISRQLDQTARALDNDFDVITVGSVRPIRGDVGRFGWKGQFSTLDGFVAAACAVELGLSNPYRKQDVAKEFREDGDAELDLNRKQFRALVEFVRYLPRPEQVLPKSEEKAKQVHNGERVFAKIGCAACHTPDLGGVKGVYSDFRLYDLSDPSGAGYRLQEDLRDLIPIGVPQPEQWKTPPLWGVADSAPYFHDGGSATLLDAIHRHAGEARKSRQAFEGLGAGDKDALIWFLKSLRAPQTKDLVVASR